MQSAAVLPTISPSNLAINLNTNSFNGFHAYMSGDNYLVELKLVERAHPKF